MESNNHKIILFQCDAQLQFNRGLHAYEKGDLEQAIVHLQNACLQDKNNLEYKLKLAKLLIENQEWERAIVSLNELTFLGWINDECDLLLAICYANLGEIQLSQNDADDYVESVLKSNQDICVASEMDKKKKVHILLQLALNYIELETFDHLLRATLFLRQAVKLDQQQYNMYNHLAAAFLSIQEYESAKECLDNVLQNEPYNISAICYYAQIYFETNQKEQLAKLLNQVKNLVPIQEYERLKLGYMFAKLGRYREALTFFSRVTQPNFRLRKSFLFWVSECMRHLGYDHIAGTNKNRLKVQFAKSF